MLFPSFDLRTSRTSKSMKIFVTFNMYVNDGLHCCLTHNWIALQMKPRFKHSRIAKATLQRGHIKNRWKTLMHCKIRNWETQHEIKSLDCYQPLSNVWTLFPFTRTSFGSFFTAATQLQQPYWVYTAKWTKICFSRLLLYQGPELWNKTSIDSHVLIQWFQCRNAQSYLQWVVGSEDYLTYSSQWNKCLLSPFDTTCRNNWWNPNSISKQQVLFDCQYSYLLPRSRVRLPEIITKLGHRNVITRVCFANRCPQQKIHFPLCTIYVLVTDTTSGHLVKCSILQSISTIPTETVKSTSCSVSFRWSKRFYT